ncbi:MAG: hypothetical protein PHU23_15160 [Dehalococcoidales bacterium]|nr:hypothetical protein [Dehalococcoidales bacterium]
MPTFHYTVDDEPQTTDLHQMTPVQILTNAGIDPASHYLIQLEGHNKISYKDKPDEIIHMHQHMKFISASMAPTPVS